MSESIVVNTNLSSINAQRNLYKSNLKLTKAMERLSSGLRINRAADDAAGLAIANGLSSQSTGLTQAVRNANDGLSVIGMADGTLSTQVGILQRIRELSVQAANDTNSADNRDAIQLEIDAQISELTRLGNITNFNGSNLIDGSFSNKKIQVGANAGQTIDMSLGDFRASGMGAIATVTGISVLGTAALGGGAGALTINGVDIGASVADGVSTTGAGYIAGSSALAKATAINAKTGATGVTATANAATYTSGTAVAGGNVLATTSLVINGTTIFSGETFATTANDGNGLLRQKINAKSNITGVSASLNAAGTNLVLTAADGRNIAVTGNAQATQIGFAAATNLGFGNITLSSLTDMSIGGTQVADAGLTSGNFAVDVNTMVNKIDVGTQSGANKAILIVDSALKKISQSQAYLGALTNRFENTIENLQVSIENLKASESRIRDADYAVETANMTQAQILQQTGTAILAQANVRPQAALTLLGR